MSFSGLLSITKKSHVRLFILGLLYPAEPLIGTVGYSGHYSTAHIFNAGAKTPSGKTL